MTGKQAVAKNAPGPRAIEAVIFDLDGTLADTIADIAQAMDTALTRHGAQPRTLEEYKRFVGNGGRELVMRALPPEKHDHVEAVLAEFRARYAEHIVEHTRPFPGVPAMLDGLQAMGIRCAVLSNKAEGMTREIVARLFGAWRFEEVLGEAEGRAKKPDPEGALLIARRLGVSPSDCVVVGDSDNDILTARRAGMRAVGVLWGYRDRSIIEASQPDAVISRPEDLLDVLRGFSARMAL